MGQPIVQVDAFADRAFRGNPAAVCVLDAPREDAWMRHVAQEMNLSETAFLHPEGDGYRLRWFTPAVEVDLCGHATLASAHVLWEDGRLAPTDVARFQTRSGLLQATRELDGWIALDFPALPPEPVPAPDGLEAALGVRGLAVLKSRFDYLVEVENEAVVRGLAPNVGRLKDLPVRGTIVTSRAESGEYDFVSRFFAPAAGVDEDPVTGSAHCVLGPYWGARLGRDRLVGFQASARGGVVRVQVRDARVTLSGQAVTVLRGELLA